MTVPSSFEAVVVGASAGGLDALSNVLPALPRDFVLPIMLVVHLPADKNNAIPELLKAKCNLDVREADDKEPIEKGIIYMAPPNYHLLIEPNGRLSLSNEEEVMFSRPSIDVLFESAAEVYAEKLIGIILSGANNDGAKGLNYIQKVGGTALVQHPATAKAAMMPESALEACPSALSLTPEEISAYLIKAGSNGRS